LTLAILCALKSRAAREALEDSCAIQRATLTDNASLQFIGACATFLLCSRNTCRIRRATLWRWALSKNTLLDGRIGIEYLGTLHITDTFALARRGIRSRRTSVQTGEQPPTIQVTAFANNARGVLVITIGLETSAVLGLRDL
jgi:hypothetical protein